MAFFTEDYENSTPVQRVVAGGACILLGAIIMLLGICGAFFDYASLAKIGFNGMTVFCYLIVVICGVLIFARMRYALVVALGASILELVLSFATQMTSTADVSFLGLLKIIVIGCCIFLATSVISLGDEEEEPMPQQPQGPRPNARGQMPPQPQQRAALPPRGFQQGRNNNLRPPQPRR